MCRSSKLTLFTLSLALLPSAARAQFYGFPSEVGVIDDGFGVLPPLPPPQQAPFGEGARAVLPPFAQPPAPPLPCPLVIKIGPGLRHQASTRVVYGRPACP